MKDVLFKRTTKEGHWVGNGFPVRSIFSYNNVAEAISPFLLLDYAGPVEFSPTDEVRGVGEHPHRGFETVTIVYDGEVEHKDSHGGGGVIRKGDVQWMTAASGLVHSEFHGREYAKRGGPFEMVQLWVNLPKKDKMTDPRYQGILDKDIPLVSFEGGSARVIAGEFEGTKGPALSFSPINLWDIRLQKDAYHEFKVPERHTTSIFVLSGEVELGSGEKITDAEIAVLDPTGDTFTLKASKDTKLLFIGGEPLNEPIVGYGPFVMNTMDEIRQAFTDFQSGRMGRL